MHIDEVRDHCISKPGVTDSFPFDQSALVFKVMGKMFLILNVDKYQGFTAKCDPEWAIALREEYPEGVLPGYHTSKTHWNTVMAFSNVPDALQAKMIDHSYDLVVAGLSKKLKAELELLSNTER